MFGQSRQNSTVGNVFRNFSTDACSRSKGEALAEIERECEVRGKCFDKWVAEGKLSETDARDRMERLVSAWHWLNDTAASRQFSAAEEAQ